MLRRGEWRATATAEDLRTVGFHLSSLYSPLGWKSWEEIVTEFLRAKSDPPLLKTWTNTVLGETWEEETGAKMGAEGLRDRAEFYQLMRSQQRQASSLVALTCRTTELLLACMHGEKEKNLGSSITLRYLVILPVKSCGTK